MNLPLNDGTTWEPPQSFIAQLAENYKGLDVARELTMAHGWLLGNPARRKSRRGIKRYLTNWLNSAYKNLPTPAQKLQLSAPTCCHCTARATEGIAGVGYCERHASDERAYLESVRARA